MKPITEYYSTRQDGSILVITKPTNNCYIRQIETGQLYGEAIDVGYEVSTDVYAPIKYTYETTDIAIEIDEVVEEEIGE